MADMHLQGKMRKVKEAAKQGSYVPESSKRIGLVIFLLFFGIGILVLAALAVTFIVIKSFIAAMITGVITLFLMYCVYKILTTDDMPSL
ncbi:hypothetical protein [Sporosarcina sp. G11-34]|uniref:hypothetical protein n=1 Tax=Sporosarcina sp. G11-34 TaxID=2849605 RepID=UPI0022A906F8|nr:hypothetical protein [Sporosarcina sp. G11-34]MCZ2257475.1 hypothetical protein [Sporosarcina sp. G11-34]